MATLVILIIFWGPKISIHGHAVNDNTWADILIECMNRSYITSNLEIRLKNPFHLIKNLLIGSLVPSKTHFTWIMTSVVIKFNISSEHVMMNISAWLYCLLCIYAKHRMSFDLKIRVSTTVIWWPCILLIQMLICIS